MTEPIHMGDIKPEEVTWLWEERIPRSMISVVAGRPDQGKGLLACRIAADLNRVGHNVLYSPIEDSFGIMTRPRLEAAGADHKRTIMWRFQVPDQLELLEQVVIKKKIDLIIMDPFNAHLGQGISRTSDSIRRVLTPLSDMLERTQTGLLIIEHALKRIPKGSHPLNAIGGSGSGLPAAARMAFILGVDPDNDDRRVLACVKNNLRDRPLAMAFEVDTIEVETLGTEVPFLNFDEELEFFDPMRLFESKEKHGTIGRPPDKRAAAAEWLTNYLLMAGNPVKAGKIMEDAISAGMTNKTLRRAADDMNVVKTPPGGGRNCVWDLPQDIKDLVTPIPTAKGFATDDELDAEIADLLGELGG
jgi:hypothetical protein